MRGRPPFAPCTSEQDIKTLPSHCKADIMTWVASHRVQAAWRWCKRGSAWRGGDAALQWKGRGHPHLHRKGPSLWNGLAIAACKCLKAVEPNIATSWAAGLSVRQLSSETACASDGDEPQLFTAGAVGFVSVVLGGSWCWLLLGVFCSG